jgi:hypothetical protein
MPTVRGPTAAATAPGSIVIVVGSMSTNRIVPPAWVIASVVAIKVWETVMTSSPGATPSAM